MSNEFWFLLVYDVIDLLQVILLQIMEIPIKNDISKIVQIKFRVHCLFNPLYSCFCSCGFCLLWSHCEQHENCRIQKVLKNKFMTRMKIMGLPVYFSSFSERISETVWNLDLIKVIPTIFEGLIILVNFNHELFT